MNQAATVRDTCVGSNLGGGMSSSGAQKLLWCIGHTFDFQACGSLATTAVKKARTWSGTDLVSCLLSANYSNIIAVEKHGRSFAELGVVPPVRLERL